MRPLYDALPFARFVIRGVGGLVARFWMPFTCGFVAAGVGAPEPSSSALTVDGRLRLLEAGEVLALGPLELVPCWLCCGCIPGACIWPGTGLPMCGDPGRFMLTVAGLAPMGNCPKLGVLGFCGAGCPFMPWGAPLMCEATYCSSAAYGVMLLLLW